MSAQDENNNLKVQKVIRAQGEYAKKGEDIKNGDVIKILNEGTWIEGQFGQQLVVKVNTRNGEKNVNFNQTTINILHDEFGADTAKWIGKEVIIRAKKDTVAGRKVEIYYFVTPDWDFDEYRELTKKNNLVKDEDIPIINEDEEKIDLKDIPF